MTPQDTGLYVVEVLEPIGWRPLSGYRPAPLNMAQSLHSYYTGTWINRFYRIKKFN